MFFIRNHFISNLLLDSLKIKKLLELQGVTTQYAQYVQSRFVTLNVSNVTFSEVLFWESVGSSV